MKVVHKNTKVTISVGALSTMLLLLDEAIDDEDEEYEDDREIIQEVIDSVELELNATVRYELNQVLFIKNEGTLL